MSKTKEISCSKDMKVFELLADISNGSIDFSDVFSPIQAKNQNVKYFLYIILNSFIKA